MRSFAFAATLLASSLLTSAKPTRRYIPNQAGNSELVVYWGGGTDQKPLADFCDDDTIDIIPIGFVNKFPGQDGTFGLPGTNFGNACWATEYYVDQQGHKTSIFSPCSNIQRDMAYCQSKGKKVLISIGGDSPGNQLASKDAATSFAIQLWQIFGPKPAGFTGPRPFGDNVIDGFDLDIESGDGQFVPDLSASLSALTAGDKSKKYYLTAAPQCPIPDGRLSAALTAAPFDHVFVQFYNNPACAARASFNGGGFNWNDWVNWLSENSMNKGISMFLGLPASPSAAPSYPDNYLSVDEATTLIESLMCSNTYKSQFAGVMLWEATFSENNQQNGKSYAANIKEVIKKCSCYPKPVTTTSSMSTVSTTSSSTTKSITASTILGTTASTTRSTTVSTTPSTTASTTSSTTASTTQSSTASTTLSTTPSTTKSTTAATTQSTMSSPPAVSTTSSTSTSTLSTTSSSKTTISSSLSTSYTRSTSSSATLSSATLPPFSSTTSASSSTSEMSSATLPPYSSSSSSITTSLYSSSSTSSIPAGSSSTEHTWSYSTSSTSATSSKPAESTTSKPVESTTSSTEARTSTGSSSSTPVKISTSTTSSSTAVHTTSSSKAADTTSSSTISSGEHTWEDWSSSSTPADSTTSSLLETSSTSTTSASVSTFSTPAASITTSVEHTWVDWPSSSTYSVPAASTTSSKSVDPSHTWEDWSPSSASTPAVSTSQTTSASYDPSHTWADWSASSSSSTPAVSTTTSKYDAHTWADWQSSSSSSPAAVISSASNWAVSAAKSTLSASGVTQGAGSSLVSPPVGTSKPVVAAAASSSPASSSYPVAPATYTGGALSDDLPGTVLSVAVCVVVAIGGLFL